MKKTAGDPKREEFQPTVQLMVFEVEAGGKKQPGWYWMLRPSWSYSRQMPVGGPYENFGAANIEGDAAAKKMIRRVTQTATLDDFANDLGGDLPLPGRKLA